MGRGLVTRQGDIAVLGRGKGGHVGYFVGWAGKGKAVLISGNSRGDKVAKGTSSASPSSPGLIGRA